MKTIGNAGKACLNGKVGTFTKGSTRMMRETGTVKCIGWMGLFTREIGRKVSNMGTAKWYFRMKLSRKDTLRITCLWGRDRHRLV